MNKKTVRQRVADIALSNSDNENAHALVEDLYVEVLRFIARDSTDHVAADLALEALKAKEIPFGRRHAPEVER